MSKNDGSGGYWNNGKWIKITWGGKISKSLASKDKTKVVCEGCGKEFEVFDYQATLTKWCGKKCSYANNYTNVADPITKKAIIVGANLVMGKGKREFLIGLIKAAIEKPCRYCQSLLTLDNINIDHMDSYKDTKKRRNKAKNKEYREHLDRRSNLQIICKKCNQLKGELDHGQFMALKEFMATDPWIEIVITRRLRRSNAPFRRSSR